MKNHFLTVGIVLMCLVSIFLVLIFWVNPKTNYSYEDHITILEASSDGVIVKSFYMVDDQPRTRVYNFKYEQVTHVYESDEAKIYIIQYIHSNLLGYEFVETKYKLYLPKDVFYEYITNRGM